MVKPEKPKTISNVQASIINYTGHLSDESPGARLFNAAVSFNFSYSATSSNFGGRVGRGGTEKDESQTIKVTNVKNSSEGIFFH